MNFIFSRSNKFQAIFFAILSCFLVSVLIAIVRHLSQDFNTFFIVMMRNFFALTFFIPFMIKKRSHLFKTKNLKLHLLRNINGLIAMCIWFYTVTLIPLDEAVSFTFIVPIITTLAAVYYLKEKVEPRLWIALLIGFIGILVIARPGFKTFHFAYILALLTTVLWSVSNVIVKMMTTTDRPETIVAYMSFIMLILSIPLGIMHLQPVNLNDIFWLAMLGLFSNLAHMAMSTAYSKADLSVVQPYDFMRFIFIAIISYFAFGEVVDRYSILGSLIIFAGTIFIAPKTKKEYNHLAKAAKDQI